MSYQSANQSRGASARPWDVRRWGRVGSALLALALGVSAATAMAAEVVEVRVGRHAQFTRVVFELDRAAGYRIERTESASGVTELVVSLEATSIPRHIESSKSLIQQVDLSPSGSRSIARIQLAKDGLKLKEMILASPPRIVLDVLSDAPIVSKVAKVPAPVVSKPAPVETRPEPKPEPVEIAVVEPEPIVEPAPVVADPIPDRPLPDVVADLDRAAAEMDSEALELDEDAALDEDVEMAETMAADESESAFDDAESLLDSSPSDSVQEPAPENLADAAPVVPPTPVKPAPRPMVAKTKADDGGGWMTWALAAVGVVVLLLGGLFVARNRSGGAADYADEDADADTIASGNPFAESGVDGDQMNMGGSENVAGQLSDEEMMIVSRTQDSEEKESESVVFADSEEEVMEVISQDAVNESLGMPPTSGEIPEEFQQMMRDMNSRVQALEGRIDELVDARDRLERQVAAQTEELRVQRAAIARTQRAVRNLARPEDEEQEATEPALRDPNKPGSQE
jgi:hypothetical protein